MGSRRGRRSWRSLTFLSKAKQNSVLSLEDRPGKSNKEKTHAGNSAAIH